jgi:hypothetical protein
MSMSMFVAEDMAEDVAGCSLVEPIVERMLSERVSVGMIQKETKSKIKDALEKRILFPNNNENTSASASTSIRTRTRTSSSNHNSDYETESKSNRYTMSPIMKYMKERCLSDGTVYVAYVPKGMGKTTACYAFANAKENQQSKVLALVSSSPTDGGTSTFPTCLESMVSLFNLRWGTLPQGFVTTLIKSLISKKNIMERIGRNRKRRNKRSYLIIDEFMSNGINKSDEKLVLQIKKLIHNTNVCVFLLSSNKESANYLLTLNDSDINNNNGGGGGGGIQPLVESSALDSIRRQRTQQHQIGFPNNNNDNDNFTATTFDWDVYCCMEWTDEQIQDAILGYDEFVDADKETKRLLKDEIKEILAYMTDNERKKSNPLDVKRKLLYSNHPTQAYSFTKSTSSMSKTSRNKSNIRTSSIRSIGSSIATSVVQSQKPSDRTILKDSQRTVVMINDAYIEMV